VTIVMSFLMSILMMSAVNFSTLELKQNGLFDKETETYEHRGMTFSIYKDDIPLRLEDLVKADPDNYIYQRRGEGSLFVSDYEMTQRTRFDIAEQEGFQELHYRIVDVKVTFVYDWCLHQLHKDLTQAAQLQNPYELRDKLAEIEPDSWAADQAWQVVSYDRNQTNHYLLRYGNRLVDITFDWPVTEEQKAIVAAKLG